MASCKHVHIIGVAGHRWRLLPMALLLGHTSLADAGFSERLNTPIDSGDFFGRCPADQYQAALGGLHDALLPFQEACDDESSRFMLSHARHPDGTEAVVLFCHIKTAADVAILKALAGVACTVTTVLLRDAGTFPAEFGALDGELCTGIGAADQMHVFAAYLKDKIEAAHKWTASKAEELFHA